MTGPRVDAARSLVVKGIRVVAGRRDVNLTPAYMGFGNHLYLWVWAYSRRDDRVSPRVLMTEKMRYWADFVPAFSRRFLVEPEDVRLTDRRGAYYAYPGSHSPDPRGFTDEERSVFIRDALLPEPLLDGVGEGRLASPDSLTINVRRGDYYSDENIAAYGFDVVSYLRLALEGSIAADGAVRRIHVVSDDLDWCRRHLDWLGGHGVQITYPDPDRGPVEHFRDLAGSRRIIMTNSTFSIWAAAVSNEVHQDNARSVWAPAFFQAVYGPGRCYEYDQQWSFVDELPEGWQPQWVLEGRDGPAA